MWLLWGLTIVIQTISFVFVSRARNSASLKRHMIASIFSNGVWFVGQMFVISVATEFLMGKHGVATQVLAGVYYTGMSLVGALSAHWLSMKTEKGKSAVGASTKYAQIPVADWEKVKKLIDTQ